MKNFLLAAAAFLAAVSCGTDTRPTITPEEAALINESSDVMRVLTVENEDDLAVLRASSRDFNAQDLNTAEYTALARKMVSTLESCEGGVGLAAPQVGINRRVVAVMRLDKEGEPIEIYPNLRIEEMRGTMEPGKEGCLSIPDKYGEVLRYRDITIVYTDINGDGSDGSSGNSGNNGGQPREIRERITGFTAVIFQHEADHLDGILYTDLLDDNL